MKIECQICHGDHPTRLCQARLLRAIDAVRRHPEDRAIRRAYEKEYAKAVEANQCGGYCENPYGCNGGCYEY